MLDVSSYGFAEPCYNVENKLCVDDTTLVGMGRCFEVISVHNNKTVSLSILERYKRE